MHFDKCWYIGETKALKSASSTVKITKFVCHEEVINQDNRVHSSPSVK